MQKARCLYCGVRDGTTADHIPPKVLFPKPRPSDLVTVPCCEVCRQGQPLDDEYFARMVTMRHDVADHPAAALVLEGVHRSLTKPQKQKFTSALLRSVREFSVHSDAGLYLGEAASCDVDLARLCKVIERTTRGLYFHEFGTRLPDDYRCKVYSLDGFSLRDRAVVTSLKRLLNAAQSGKTRVFGQKVFTYSVLRIEQPKALTVWAFLVYSRVIFFALTYASDLVQDETGAA